MQTRGCDAKKPVVIHAAEELLALRAAKRSVRVRLGWSFDRILPAAFVCNMNFSVVARMLRDGIEVYEKPKSARRFPLFGRRDESEGKA